MYIPNLHTSEILAMEYCTHYDAILCALASKFYNDLPLHEKPKPADYPTALRNTLFYFTASAAHDPVWLLWLRVQKGIRDLGKKERTVEKSKRMSGDELYFFAEAAMHQRCGGHSIRIPSQAIENISGWKLDRNIKVKDISDLGLPNYVWFEWPRIVTEGTPPWISRTVGVLVSRFVLLDAPTDILHKLVDPPLVDKDDTLELMRELLKSTLRGIPCLGYRLMIVQEDNNGYRFVPSMFGHEKTEPLIEMLTLLKEVSDRDRHKFRQTEQVWSNVAMRLLLFAAHKGLFEGGGTPDVNDGLHRFYCENGETKKRISIRPDYHSRLQPFAVTNE